MVVDFIPPTIIEIQLVLERFLVLEIFFLPRGEVQAMLRKGIRSMNLWASRDIRLVVSPTEIQREG